MRRRRRRALYLLLVLVVAIGIAAHLVLHQKQHAYSDWAFRTIAIQQRYLSAAASAAAYGLKPDSSIGAEAAGRALYVVFMAGRQPEALQRAPDRSIEQTWMNRDPSSGAVSEYYALAGDPAQLFGAVARGLTDDERAYLLRVSKNPAFTEYSIAARARRADITGAIYALPFPRGTFSYDLAPAVGIGEKDAAYAHFARAALYLADGRTAAADTAIREVISVGRLTVNETPFVMDALVAAVTVKLGYQALAALYETSGDTAAAAAVRQAATAAGFDPSPGDRPAAFESFDEARSAMYRTLADSSAVKSMRWEALLWVANAPCFTAGGLLFGPGDRYREAVQQARTRLPARESEVALFDLIARSHEYRFGRCLRLQKEY